MSQALRKLAAIVAQSNTCFIFINQIREKIGVMFGSPETTTGGRALKFYASPPPASTSRPTSTSPAPPWPTPRCWNTSPPRSATRASTLRCSPSRSPRRTPSPPSNGPATSRGSSQSSAAASPSTWGRLQLVRLTRSPGAGPDQDRRQLHPLPVPEPVGPGHHPGDRRGGEGTGRSRPSPGTSRTSRRSTWCAGWASTGRRGSTSGAPGPPRCARGSGPWTPMEHRFLAGRRQGGKRPRRAEDMVATPPTSRITQSSP